MSSEYSGTVFNNRGANIGIDFLIEGEIWDTGMFGSCPGLSALMVQEIAPV